MNIFLTLASNLMTGALLCAPTIPMEPIYPYRQSTRLQPFDYGQMACYFISLVTLDRRPILGRIMNGMVQLSEYGKVVQEEWLRTPLIRPSVQIDEWIVMPDHFHAILFIKKEMAEENKTTAGTVGAHSSAPANPLQRQPRTLGSLVAQFKSVTTKRINEIRKTPGDKIWQRNYNDRIIRNEVELDKKRKYIRNNPGKTYSRESQAI